MLKIISILPIILLFIYSFGNSEQILTKDETNRLLVNGLNGIINSMKWNSFNESYTTYSDILNKVVAFKNDELKLIYNQFILQNNSTGKPSEEIFKQYINNEIFEKIASLEIEIGYLKNRITSSDYDSSMSSLERPIRLQQFLKEWSTTLKSLVVVILNQNYPNFNYINESSSIVIVNSSEPLSSFRDCNEFYCPEMIVIPTGSFLMGISQFEQDYFNDTLSNNEIRFSKPIHSVSFKNQKFAMASKEVTLEEFKLFINETGYSMPKGCLTPIPKNHFPDFTDVEWDFQMPGFVPPNNIQDGKQPVVCVRREDGVRYAQWLSKKTNQLYRLPFESEWEYCARSNTGNNIFIWGNDTKDACKYANVLDQSTSSIYGVPSKNCFPCNDTYPTTAKVGSYLPNQFKIYDMAGNAREWINENDCWHDSFDNAPNDGSSWSMKDKESNPMCRFGILRGGGWIYDINHLRLAYRNAYYSSQVRSNMWGFRLVREL